MATDAPLADCPSENLLTELMEGRLSASQRAQLHGHLDACSACRALLSDLAKAEVDVSAATDRLADAVTASVPEPSTERAVSGGRRFELLRKLGQGGMGVVYEAFDRIRNQRVACKTLRSLSADALLRFKHEFRALQDVQHPNLVTLGDLVEESGQWWLTMELVDGVDFLSHARDEARLRAALAELAAGLGALHAAHKVHRDIKPQNVLVTAAGRVVILDFGLIGDTQAVDSAVVGTAAYMAPEQASGGRIEPAADWWSVGVMLYEALTGQRPFARPAALAADGRLREELVPPRLRTPGIAADLDALCVELLSPEPARRPQGAEVLRRLHAPAGPLAAAHLAAQSGAAPSSVSFVGRRSELAALHDAFARRRSGEPGLFLVLGESGVGKSALVHELVAQLHAEVAELVVLSGRCYERETVPYKAIDGIVDALARYLKRLPKDEAAALLPRRAAALLQAFPVLGRVAVMPAAAAEAVETADPTEQRSRVFSALRELLTRLAARRPLLLTIDDLQWADADSLAMLAPLLAPPEPPALLLLATARPLDAGSPADVAAAVQRIGAVQTLALGPLPPSDARALAERLLARSPFAATRARPELVESVAVESGGHPLFIDALIQHAGSRDEGRAGRLRLDDAMAASFERMEGAARRLLALVSVAGRPLGQQTLSAAAALEPEVFGRIERGLRAAHMLRGLPPAALPDSGASEVDFVEPYHDRVRETLLARLPAEELRACHQRLASVLETSGRAEPEELARHFRGAGDLPRAARYTLRAAERAEKTLAFAHAARLFEDALSLAALEPEARAQAQVRLGEMRNAAGQPREAARAFLDAAQGAGSVQQLAYRQRAAELLLQNGVFGEGRALLAEVLRAVGLSFPVSGHGAFLRFLWLRLRLYLRGLRFAERAEPELLPRERLRVDACWSAAIGHLLFEPLQAMALHAQHLLLALELGEPMRIARALSVEAILRNFLGGRHQARADALIAESQRLGRAVGSAYVLGFSAMTQSLIAFHRGRLRDSVERACEAEAILRKHCPAASWELRACQGVKILNLGMMGRYGELAPVLEDFARVAHERGDSNAENNGQIWLLVVCLARGEIDRARRISREMYELVSRTGSTMQEGNAFQGELMLTLYVEPERALARYYEIWLPRLRRSSMRMSQPLRVWVLSTEGTARLHQTGSEFSPRRIRRIAEKLERAGSPQALASSLALRAALAHRLGERCEAVRLATLLEASSQEAQYGMNAAIARYRQGQYLGEEAGRALRESAIAAMSAEGVRDPERFARTLLP